GLVVGRLAIWLSAWLVASEQSVPSSAKPKKSTSVHSAAIATGLGLLAAIICTMARAAEGSHENHDSDALSTEPLQVLIPVGADGKPTGGMYFLAEQLRNELLKRSGELDLEQ